MKKAILISVFAILFTLISSAQDYRMSDITISSGRGALSSGIFISTNITNDQNRLTFEVEKDFAQAIFGTQMKNVFVAGSAGFFQNTPWIGPFLVFQPGIFTIISWNGVAAGQANNPDWKLKFIFAFHSIRMDLGPVYFSYARISFQKDRVNNLPGMGFIIPVGSKITCSVGGEYTLRDKNPLFGASLNYKL
jgi:hypothetical protein